MKNVKRIFVAVAILTSMAAKANDLKVISGGNGEVTITERNNKVNLSILNNQSESYTLYIVFKRTGDLVYQGTLGTNTSIGRVFDFDGSVEGEYTFKLVAASGKSDTYDIKTGSEF